jgi:hypothetical protein
MSDSGVSDACIFVSLALFVVWMQRQKVSNLGNITRWGAFFGAISGKYTIPNNVSSSSSSSTTSTSSGTSSGSSTPSTSTTPFGVGGGYITKTTTP